MSSFKLIGLPIEPFLPLFALSDAQLEELNARRVVAASHPGYPCRSSLIDAQIGEELLLLPFEHQAAISPYKASGPIYVRRAAVQATLEDCVIPDYVSRRLISVRAYDDQDLMCDAAVCPGNEVATTIDTLFSNTLVAYIHLHNANRGCFSCRVDRADRLGCPGAMSAELQRRWEARH